MSSAYSTATGTSAEEIVIEGGKFISPDQVQAPEENIPGQVLDSLSIKVYQNSIFGAPALKSKILLADGETTLYNIGQNILESKSLLVYVDKVRKEAITDFELDIKENTINFLIPPVEGASIEILSIGPGGLELLDYQEYVADGETNLFLTNADFDNTSSIFVTINGVEVDAGFIDSTGEIDATNRTLIQFATAPSFNATIKIICLGSALDTDSTGQAIARINEQSFTYSGFRNIELDKFVDLSRGSALSSVLIEVNGKLLQGVDTTYFEYDGNTRTFILGVDPEETPGTILPDNIVVYVNNEKKIFITDYIYDGVAKELTIDEDVLKIGDKIKIENDFRTEYSIQGNDIIIDDSVTLVNGDDISVTWFSEYPSFDIVSDEYTGGKVNYKLAYAPLSASYVWVYKNGERLVQEVDYSVSLPRGVVYLTNDTTENDEIKIVLFGSEVYRLPSAFEIHKDMLNIYHFKRLAVKDVELAKELNYYDLVIEVNDASELDEPNTARNIPGIVVINNERIEYLQKTGNILSQLRRGSGGTAIKDYSAPGTRVVNAGITDSLPYTETQDRLDFYSDGSSVEIGPLGYIPEQTENTNWYRDTITEEYGQCDTIEVFVGGNRLRKSPISVYNELLGASSPSADEQIEAEFSVDGTTQYIRLTTAPPAGTRISVIRKTGQTWYDKGEATASAGTTLLENESAIAKFIAEKTTKLPE